MHIFNTNYELKATTKKLSNEILRNTYETMNNTRWMNNIHWLMLQKLYWCSQYDDNNMTCNWIDHNDLFSKQKCHLTFGKHPREIVGLALAIENSYLEIFFQNLLCRTSITLSSLLYSNILYKIGTSICFSRDLIPFLSV